MSATGDSYRVFTDKADASLADGALARLHKRMRYLWVAIGLLGLLMLGLIAGLIALGIKVGEYHDSDSSVAAGSTNAMLSTSSKVPNGFRSRGTLDASAGTWVRKADFPGAASQGVSDGAVAAVGARVYFVGGNVGGGVGNNVTDGVYIFDPLEDTFEAGPRLPRAMARGAAAYDEDSQTLYYAAGTTRNPERAKSGAATFGGAKTPCLFALATGKARAQWQELPCMSTPRSDFCAAFVGGKLYVVGGMDADFNGVDTIESYDPQRKQWSTEQYKLPYPRLDLACAALGNKIYAVGGIDNKCNGFDDPDCDWANDPSTWFSNTNAEIDVEAGIVAEKAPLPKARGDLGLAAFGDAALLAVGGETTDTTGGRTTIGSHDVFMYDAASDIWVPKAPMPEARFRVAAVQVPSVDDSVAVAVLGGHHRCEDMADDDRPNDDGGCDEIAHAAMFLDSPAPPLFVYTPA